MALTTNQKTQLRKFLHASYSRHEMPLPWVKADVDQAITDLDTFLDDNQVNINAAMSEPFRSTASAADKAVLFTAIAAASYILGNSGAANVLKDVAGKIAELSGS